MTGTRGVALVGRILQEIAEAADLTVDDFVERTGTPRSSVFEAVRRLEQAGLVNRRLGGRLALGPVTMRLGFAAFGLASLHGPAEALLRLLRDQTDGTATLYAGDVVLVDAPQQGRNRAAQPTFQAKIGPSARLDLTLSMNATRTQRCHAEIVFQQVVVTLEGQLLEGDRHRA